VLPDDPLCGSSSSVNADKALGQHGWRDSDIDQFAGGSGEQRAVADGKKAKAGDRQKRPSLITACAADRRWRNHHGPAVRIHGKKMGWIPFGATGQFDPQPAIPGGDSAVSYIPVEEFPCGNSPFAARTAGR